MIKVIYIVEHPYWQRDHHRFGGEYLEEQGYAVEIWRMLQTGSADIDANDRMYQKENLYNYSWRQFRKQVQIARDAVFILQNEYNKYYEYLRRNGIRCIVLTGFAKLPIPPLIPKGKHIKDRLSRWIERGIIESIKSKKNYIYKKRKKQHYDLFVKSNPPEAIITSTKYAMDPNYATISSQCKIYYIHSLDYDRYIEANRIDNSLKEEFILYCDSGYFGKSYDALLSGKQLNTEKNKQEYFTQLEKVFKHLEDYYQLPVVISGHPHTVYTAADYNGRRIVFDKTCELTRDAKVFIMNYTTAVSYALLYNKPILMLCNQSFRNVFESDRYQYINEIARETLEVGFLDLDDEDQIKSAGSLCGKADPRKRQKYLKQYVIDGNVTQKTIPECLEEIIR